MKINQKLKIRKIVGENIVLLQSSGTNDMTKILSLNSTSLFLWEKLSGTDFTLEDVVKLLIDNYEVEEERARTDAQNWINQLLELHVVE